MHAESIKQLVRFYLKMGSASTELGSLYIEGPPGVGKSQVVQDVAKEEAVGFIDFRLLLRDPTDLRGIPVPDMAASQAAGLVLALAALQGGSGEEARDRLTHSANGTQVTHWLPPSDLPHLHLHGERGILFFDDLPTAPPLVQASAYQITIAPHKLGEYQLPPGWVIIAAGNRRGEGLVHPVPAPLRNRFTRVSFEVSLEEWSVWAVRAGIHPACTAFIHWAYGRETAAPNWPLFRFDPQRDEWAFPTPRAWERVSRKLTVLAGLGDLTEVIEGDLGAGTAVEFAAFLQVFGKVPDPLQILAGKFVVPKSADLLYATVMAVAAKAQPDQYGTAVEYADKLPTEFAVLLVKTLANKNIEALRAAPRFAGWAHAHRDVLL